MGGFLQPVSDAFQNMMQRQNYIRGIGMQEAGATQRTGMAEQGATQRLQSQLQQGAQFNSIAAWDAQRQHLLEQIAQTRNDFPADYTTQASLADLENRLQGEARPQIGDNFTQYDPGKTFDKYTLELGNIRHTADLAQKARTADHVAATSPQQIGPGPALPGQVSGAQRFVPPFIQSIQQQAQNQFGGAAMPSISPVQQPGGGTAPQGTFRAPDQSVQIPPVGTAAAPAPSATAVSQTQSGVQQGDTGVNTQYLQNRLQEVLAEANHPYVAPDLRKIRLEEATRIQNTLNILGAGVSPEYAGIISGMALSGANVPIGSILPQARTELSDVTNMSPEDKIRLGIPANAAGNYNLTFDRFNQPIRAIAGPQRITKVPGADRTWHLYDENARQDLGSIPGSTVTALDPLLRSTTQYLGNDGQLHTMTESQRQIIGGPSGPAPISQTGGGGQPLTTPVQKPTQAPPSGGGQMQLIPSPGPHTIADVPAAIRPQVQQMVDYNRADPPPGRDDLTTRAMMNWVMAVDPGHDASDFQAKNAMVRAYTTGPASRQINAAVTGVNHAQALLQAGDALNNGDLPLLNRIANVYKLQTGKSAPAVYNSIVQALAPELARAYGQNTGEERQALMNGLSADASPAQRKGVIFARAQLLRSSLQPLADQWDATVHGQGTNSFDQRFLRGNKAVLDQMANAAGLNRPITGMPGNYKDGDTRVINGTTYVRSGGKWQPR